MPNNQNKNGVLGAKRLVTVPNLLSLSRLVMLPIILLLLVKHQVIPALVLMGVSWITDGLDGFLARRMNLVSDLGRVLDHLVDKIWIGSVLVTLVCISGLPLFIAAAVIGRDLLILAGNLIIMKYRGSFSSSDVLGKITGFAFGVMMVYYTINLPALRPYKMYVDYTVTVLIIVSFLNYFVIFLRKMGKSPPSQPESVIKPQLNTNKHK